jgi:carbamoyltransferase
MPSSGALGAVLINTSFNTARQPIMSSPSDALKTFFASGIDALAMENFLVEVWCRLAAMCGIPSST